MKLLKKFRKDLQKCSYFADTLVWITESHVNTQNYPDFDKEYLEQLKLMFYSNLEECILNSVLEHADHDILSLYEGTKNDISSKDYNYKNFDQLLSIAFTDDELRERVSADIEDFALKFKDIALRLWS